MYTQQSKLIEDLTAAGIKPSLQRIAILEYLRSNYTHPTVDEIYSTLLPNMPTLSRTTVYNTLKLFTASKLSLSLNLDEETVHFDGNTSPHAHFICENCKKIYDMALPNKTKSLNKFKEGEVKRMELSFFGVCTTCKENITDYKNTK